MASTIPTKEKTDELFQQLSDSTNEKKVLLNFKEKFGILDLKNAVNSKIELKQKKSKVQ